MPHGRVAVSQITFRDSAPEEDSVIHSLAAHAFGRSEEADLALDLMVGPVETLSLVAVRDDRIARRVEALPVVGELETGATVVVQADPRLWVRQMRFDDWAGGATRETDEEIVIDAPSRLHNAWYLGLRDPAGWSLRVEAAESP